MLATLAAPPTRDGWAVEWKFDGQRACLAIDDDVTVFSRNGADVTSVGVRSLGACGTYVNALVKGISNAANSVRRMSRTECIC